MVAVATLSVPVPFLVRPLTFASRIELIVKVFDALNWLTTSSAPPVVSVPPVMAVALLPTVLVTRTPPEESVSVLLVAMVTVGVVAAVLKRRLLMLWFVQAAVLVAWKSTFAVEPGAVVPATEAV